MLLLWILTFFFTSQDVVPVQVEGRIRPFDVVMDEAILEYVRHEAPPTLHPELPLQHELTSLTSPLRAVPSRWEPSVWIGLEAFSYPGLRNFTAYSEAHFQLLQHQFLSWKKGETNFKPVAEALALSYNEWAGKPLLEAHGTTFYFPTWGQLYAEMLYFKWPFLEATLLLYLLALFLFLVSPSLWALKGGWLAYGSGWVMHTLILGLRMYILGRPPVSNMMETVIYVPWIAVTLAALLSLYFKTRLLPFMATLLATILLALLMVTPASLDQVQPVLNSRYWLTVHVLMIVASYGVLILCGLLAHADLIISLRTGRHPLTSLILTTLYLGVALLIPGTILGGVWAAESWGRFWDWDPKESWAFISASIYLLVIHAYTFKKIDSQGLAIGAISGLIAIAFTWYGVNYILGTGLHSYGFGSGGTFPFVLFVAVEGLFLGSVFFLKKSPRWDKS